MESITAASASSSSSSVSEPSNDIVNSATSSSGRPTKNNLSNDVVQSASSKNHCLMRNAPSSKRSPFMVPSYNVASNSCDDGGYGWCSLSQHHQPYQWAAPPLLSVYFDGPSQLSATHYGTLFTNYPSDPTLPLVSPLAPHQPYLYYFPPNELMLNILNQIDYYFSNDNLAKDVFLRSKMDDQGWVPIELIASFKRVSELTNDHQLILDSMRYSYTVEIQDKKLRRGDNWEKWLLPPQLSRNK